MHGAADDRLTERRRPLPEHARAAHQPRRAQLCRASSVSTRSSRGRQGRCLAVSGVCARVRVEERVDVWGWVARRVFGAVLRVLRRRPAARIVVARGEGAERHRMRCTSVFVAARRQRSLCYASKGCPIDHDAANLAMYSALARA